MKQMFKKVLITIDGVHLLIVFKARSFHHFTNAQKQPSLKSVRYLPPKFLKESPSEDIYKVLKFNPRKLPLY